jgi:phage shock protein A
VSDELNSGSIVSEVGERLDDIFGKDEGGIAPLESENALQLDELRGLLFTIDREISDETISAINIEVKQLERFYTNDTQVLALLKIMSLVAGYMKAKKADIHPETSSLLNSVFRCLENVVENKGLSTHEKRALIEKEITNFNKFKVKISSRGGPSAKETMQRIKEAAAEDSEPVTTPEQSLETAPPGEFFTALDDLRAFLIQELTTLKSRFNGLKAALASSDNSRDRLREEFKAFKDRMNDMKVFSEDFKNLPNYIREKFASQKVQIDNLKGISDELDNVRSQLAEEFVNLKDQVNDLKGELSRLRDDLNIACAEIEVIKGSLCNVRTAPLSDGFSRNEEEIKEVEESPENFESAPDWDLLEQDLIAEGASPADKPQGLQIDGETIFKDEKPEAGEEGTFDESPVEREPETQSTDSVGYFLFEMGGKRYAVDEGNVIKVSKAGRRLLKKASDKGGLTMNDCRRMFSDVKRGIEPEWDHLSSKDLEKTTFHLLTDDRVDGLLDTKGGGMLFLGSGEKRSILFTDQLPKKEWLSREDKVKSLTGLEYVCGAIEKKGDDAEEYLILDADKLCKRLRVSIPAPFTEI